MSLLGYILDSRCVGCIHRATHYQKSSSSLYLSCKEEHSLLTEATIPQSILTNLISTHKINNKILVFDGGGIDNPPIRSPDGVVWQSIPICEGNYIHICDEVDPHCRLTFQWVDNVKPFIRLPRAQSLNTLPHNGHYSIIKAHHACKKLNSLTAIDPYWPAFLTSFVRA